MNVYDSERMAEALAREGYAETAELETADLVILNTCHIREKAAEKVYSDLGRIRDIKDARGGAATTRSSPLRAASPRPKGRRSRRGSRRSISSSVRKAIIVCLS